MLKKRKFKKDNIVKVTFIAPERDAQNVELLGEFNDWMPMPMKRHAEGDFRATVDLQPGAEYQYRYRVDGQRWCCDDSADGQVDNPFGDKNSVVWT